MHQNSGLKIEQRQTQRLTHQQLRFVRMLELTAPELDEAVERELDENPALDTAEEEAEQQQPSDPTPYYLRRARNWSPDDEPYDFTPADDNESLYDNLLRQLSERELPPAVALTAEYIVGNLDGNGYLRRPLDGIAADMEVAEGVAVGAEEVEAALEAVQGLDPAGIGARTLQESLELQLRRLEPSERTKDALAIVTEQFDAFTKKHTHRLMSALHISRERVLEAVSLIVSLNPKPGSALGSGSASRAAVIIPDVFIDNEDGEISVTLNNRFPELRIEESFEQAMRRLEKEPKNSESRRGREFLTMNYNNARDFIRIIKRRQDTLMGVVAAIIKIQREYFLTEDVGKLKPMIMKDIEGLTGYNLSVISRCTNNKYAATPWGIFPLRFFFSDTLEDKGDVTQKGLQEILRKLVEAEDKHHPLSDATLRELMAAQGHELSRRTVAKYRDKMGIPVARLRKEN